MIKYFSLLFLCVFAFVSCLSTDPPTEEKHVAMYFKSFNIGEMLEYGDNEIFIEEFKFALDRFTLFGSDDLVLETGGLITAMIFAYNENMDNYRLIIDVGLGFSDDFRFEGYNMALQPIQERRGIMDDDFFSEEGNYSVVIKGEVNDVGFEFKSSEAFEKMFNFSGVQLSEQNETIAFRKSIDLQTIFSDEENNFLDPRDEEIELQIMENIYNNLQLEASAVSLGI